MNEVKLIDNSISDQRVEETLRKWVHGLPLEPKKVLLLPPDYTRSHSKAGLIVRVLYQLLSPSCQVDIMPALGTHAPVSAEERKKMFGPEIPEERFFVHDWRHDVEKIGEIPGEVVSEVSGGKVDYPVKVEINKRLLDKTYDLIISIGQVVPHEVVGMANYSKNIFVGCGGKDFINKSHFLGAVYGMERLMGRDYSPVRRLFDYAEEKFLTSLPLQYILTVTTSNQLETKLHGLFIGRDRSIFEEAVKLSQKHNMDLLEAPLQKVVVYLDSEEFKSTWLGNKAIYRTRMAIADGGELIILAPGVKQFGEDQLIDGLIRKYGYIGTEKILKFVRENEDLRNNLSAAAHLIHGSSEDRFKIVYAPGSLSREEVEAVNFHYMPLPEALQKYNPKRLENGFNNVNGEEIFYISNPALGLWALREKFI